MAIKKGAFELYTQERKLPDKKPTNSLKKNFFEDSYNKEIGSQTVHTRFANNDVTLISSENTKEVILQPFSGHYEARRAVVSAILFQKSLARGSLMSNGSSCGYKT
ncbi:MAG: hypothetical protein H0U73_00555, partial [Tatlockia sp.]|nr:hypothetical protein [Tatlockia sp.]